MTDAVQRQPTSAAPAPRAPAHASTGRPRRQFLSLAALKTGLHLVAGPGSGKSRLVGRLLLPQAFAQGVPAVVLDPTGGVVDNILDKLQRLPLAARKQVWPRLVYVDAGATDYVVPSPLYYRQSPHDTLFEIANRLPAVFKRQDPSLASAPILGLNSLLECATYGGQIAAALGRQLDFVADLIAQPRLYKAELRHTLTTHPDLAPAVAYFREMMDPSTAALRERRTGSFSAKLLPFLADPLLLATFAAPTRGVDWAEVVAKRQIVLVDFRHEREPSRRQFKLIWWFRSFIDFVKLRGMAGRGHEIFFIIDEITQLTGQRGGDGRSIFADDLEELIAVLARNYGILVVAAHQNLSQVDESIRNVLMQCGTQVVGAISNPEDAEFLARQLFRYDPFKVKKREPVWMALPVFDRFGHPLGYSEPEIVDYRTVEFTPEEQVLQAVAAFRLPRFKFLVRPATEEGTTADTVYRISIANLAKGQYPDANQVAHTLALLRQKCGVPVAKLLDEIAARRTQEAPGPENSRSLPRQAPARQTPTGQPPARKQVKSPSAPAILQESPPAYEDANPVPHPSDPAGDGDTLPSAPTFAPDALPAEDPPPTQGRLHDDFWR